MYTSNCVGNKISKGQYFEELACKYLKYKGYTIMLRNYKSRYGEIDIIASKEPLCSLDTLNVQVSEIIQKKSPVFYLIMSW